MAVNKTKTSFSFDIKQELLFPYSKWTTNQKKELIKGIIFSVGLVNTENNTTTLKFSNPWVSQKVKNIFKQISVKTSFVSTNKNWIVISNNDLILDLKINDPAAFFAGVFIGSGSISTITSSSYHLEIHTKNEKYKDLMLKKLSKHFSFSVIVRKNTYFLYIKKVQEISDFLAAIQAHKNYLIFATKKIDRDYYNFENRLINLEISNSKKVVNLNEDIRKNLSYIKEHHLTSAFSEEQLYFYEFKLKNMSLSLSATSEKLKEFGINISKSGLNHWIIKLKKVVETNEENMKE